MLVPNRLLGLGIPLVTRAWLCGWCVIVVQLPAVLASPFWLPFLPQEGSREEEEEVEEKRVILVAGVRVQEGDGGRLAGSPPPRPTAGACGLKPPPSPLFRCLSFRDLGVG